jgi:hypothetical protein
LHDRLFIRLLANELESVTLPDGTTDTPSRRARRVCSLNGKRLQLNYLHKTFCSQADRERTHELPRTSPLGESLLPFETRVPTESFSNHSYGHS